MGSSGQIKLNESVIIEKVRPHTYVHCKKKVDNIPVPSRDVTYKTRNVANLFFKVYAIKTYFDVE
jgi:hypothetical protein